MARRDRAAAAAAPSGPSAACIAPRLVRDHIGDRTRPDRGLMMRKEEIRVSQRWLDLREPADAAARAPDLVDQLVRRHPARGRWMIHDLGCGTGAMGRWLAPLLPGPQHWVLRDRDA